MTETKATPLPDLPLTPHLREILAALDPSAQGVDKAISLPPDCYTSEEWFEFEKRAIFDRDWVCLGHHSLIPKPGDYYSITMNDDPLLVLRGKDGEVRVMSAVCAHRGPVLGEARGNTDVFTCPFHGWSYNVDGELVSAPEMDATLPFEELQKKACLPQIRTEVWNGFIFMNMDGQARPLASRLKRLSKEVENHHLADLVTPPLVEWADNPWNWKFMQENAIEPYHTWYLHKGPHDFAPSRLASFDEWLEDDDGAIYHPTGFVELDGGFNIANKCLMPVIKTLTEKERKRVMFATVAPNLFFGAQPDCVFFYVICPQGANSLTLQVGALVPKETMRLPDFDMRFGATVEGVSVFNDQDTVANTLTHKGLRSRFAGRTRYAPKEETLSQFNRWLVKRYKSYGDDLSGMKRAAE